MTPKTLPKQVTCILLLSPQKESDSLRKLNTQETLPFIVNEGAIQTYDYAHYTHKMVYGQLVARGISVLLATQMVHGHMRLLLTLERT